MSEYFYKLSNDVLENGIVPTFLLFFTFYLMARNLNLGVSENETKKGERVMALIRFKPEREVSTWTPFRDLVNMQREVGRLFDSFFSDFDGEGNSVASWSPRTDVSENNEAYVIKAELPGINKNDVKITLRENVLTIKGEKKQEKEEKDHSFHRVERSYGGFERSFSLPSGVKGEKIDAAYKDGILTLTLPKVEEAKPKEIEVKVA